MSVAAPAAIAPMPSSDGDDRHGLSARELLAQTILVAAGDVAGLVRDHADDLVRRLGLQQRAGVDEHAAAGDEGVEARIVDQDDFDAGLRQARRLEDRPRIVAHQRLDLGIADDRHVLRMRGGWQPERNHSAEQRDRGARGNNAARRRSIDAVMREHGIRAKRRWKGGAPEFMNL